MCNSDLVEFISHTYPECVKMEGFDDCILGVCQRIGNSNCIAYDLGKVIRKLMKEGMTRREALEYFEFNQLGAFVGETTPVFIDTFKEPDDGKIGD